MLAHFAAGINRKSAASHLRTLHSESWFGGGFQKHARRRRTGKRQFVRMSFAGRHDHSLSWLDRCERKLRFQQVLSCFLCAGTPSRSRRSVRPSLTTQSRLLDVGGATSAPGNAFTSSQGNHGWVSSCSDLSGVWICTIAQTYPFTQHEAVRETVSAVTLGGGIPALFEGTNHQVSDSLT
jgi:hypothetical protein